MPMWCTIIENEAEANAAVEKAKQNGLRLACVSNAGLKHPKRRLTFLGEDAFVKGTNADGT